MSSPYWPVVLVRGPVRLRPLRYRDEGAWRRLRMTNDAWLAPWEATSPDPVGDPGPSFRAYVRSGRKEARAGAAMPFVIEYHEEFVGQLTVSGIVRGSLSSGSLGYWISERVAGRGIVTLAVAMTIDYCLGQAGLHRIEINIRPENAASLRVVEKLGLREEGRRERYIHIAGAWADHRSFAITREEWAGPLAERLPIPQ